MGLTLRDPRYWNARRRPGAHNGLPARHHQRPPAYPGEPGGPALFEEGSSSLPRWFRATTGLALDRRPQHSQGLYGRNAPLGARR